MKKTVLTAVAMMFLASPIFTAAEASAQSRHEARQELRHDRKELRHDRKEVRQDRKAVRRAVRLKRGGRYHSGGHTVGNYRHYGLRAPGRGQHWVRYNNDYLLVSIASGVIASIVVAR